MKAGWTSTVSSQCAHHRSTTGLNPEAFRSLIPNETCQIRQTIIRIQNIYIFESFSVVSNFISPNEQQMLYFSRVKIQLLVFMSEIKFALTLKKSNFLFLLSFYS